MILSAHSRGHVDRIGTIALWILLPLIGPSSATGQVEPAASVGDRLRVTTLEGVEQTTVGILVAAREGDLLLQDGDQGSVTAFPLASISRVEVSQGRTSQWAKGLGWGFFTGGFMGAVYGLANADTNGWDVPGGVALGLGAGIGGVGGGLVGLAIGLASHTEIWHPVDPGSIGVGSPPPPYGGMSLRLRLIIR